LSKGFYGKILEIDLSTGTQRETVIEEEKYRLYLGGSGLAARIFDERGYEKNPPLAEEAPLLIFTGILTGYNVPTACKAAFCGNRRLPASGLKLLWVDSGLQLLKQAVMMALSLPAKQRNRYTSSLAMENLLSKMPLHSGVKMSIALWKNCSPGTVRKPGWQQSAPPEKTKR
jgi:hypothetical protein